MKKNVFTVITVGFIVSLIILAPFSFGLLKLTSCTDQSIVVKDKERIVDNRESKYLIFTEGEVFENTDFFLKWKFNSSDVYSNLDVGKEYQVEVCGWRIQFLSWYRNIIEIR